MPYSINNLNKCGHKCILSKEICCNCSENNNKLANQYKYFCSICKNMPKYSINNISTISTITKENHVFGFFT